MVEESAGVVSQVQHHACGPAAQLPPRLVDGVVELVVGLLIETRDPEDRDLPVVFGGHGGEHDMSAADGERKRPGRAGALDPHDDAAAGWAAQALHHLIARQSRGWRAVDRDDAVVGLDSRMLGWSVRKDGENADLGLGRIQGDADAIEAVSLGALLPGGVGRGIPGEAVESADGAVEHDLVQLVLARRRDLGRGAARGF